MSTRPDTRQQNGVWALREWNDPAAEIDLASLQCRLKISEIYAKVTFDEQATDVTEG